MRDAPEKRFGKIRVSAQSFAILQLKVLNFPVPMGARQDTPRLYEILILEYLTKFPGFATDWKR
jgi:hypothetical protein